jgi:hypothetical protein
MSLPLESIELCSEGSMLACEIPTSDRPAAIGRQSWCARTAVYLTVFSFLLLMAVRRPILLPSEDHAQAQAHRDPARQRNIEKAPCHAPLNVQVFALLHQPEPNEWLPLAQPVPEVRLIPYSASNRPPPVLAN